MDGFFPIFFLMVILKIPVAALLYLVARRLLAAARPRWPDGALTLGAVLAALLFAV